MANSSPQGVPPPIQWAELAQQGAEFTQHIVADGVAIAIVDQLEVIGSSSRAASLLSRAPPARRETPGDWRARSARPDMAGGEPHLGAIHPCCTISSTPQAEASMPIVRRLSSTVEATRAGNRPHPSDR